MDTYCDTCEGISYHVTYIVEDKQGYQHEVIECVDCETRTICK